MDRKWVICIEGVIFAFVIILTTIINDVGKVFANTEYFGPKAPVLTIR